MRMFLVLSAHLATVALASESAADDTNAAASQCILQTGSGVTSALSPDIANFGGGGPCSLATKSETSHLKLTVLTKTMAFGRPGGLFGQTLYTRYLTEVSPGWPTWQAKTIRVRVTDGAASPVAGVKVSWSTGEGISNGWVFPLAVDQKTDSGGFAEAYWTAGSGIKQYLNVSIPGTVVTVVGKAGGQRTLAAALYHSYQPPEDWDAWSLDVAAIMFPKQSYWALINMWEIYSGLLPDGVLFTTWWNTDDGKKLKTEIVDPPVGSDGRFENSTHACHQTENGAEGYHASCKLKYDIVEGHKYRFELQRAFKQSPLATEFTIYFSDLTNDTRFQIATMIYPGKHLDQKTTGGFFEMPWGDMYTCLDTPHQYAVFSNMRYRPAGSSTYKGVDRMKLTAGHGCANTWSEVREDGVHLSNGGTWVGWPVGQKKPAGLDDQWIYLTEGYSTHTTNCSDGLKNGAELGVDCGGPHCSNKCGEAPTCSDGIQNGNEEYVDCGGHCDACDKGLTSKYKVISGSRTFHQAQDACKAIGGTLAVIADRYQNMVAKKVCDSSCWIGLFRTDSCKTPSCWQWANGLFLDETVFNQWGYPGWDDLYKDGFEGVQLIQKGLGEWRVVTKGDSVGATLCSTEPALQRQEAQYWRVSPGAHAWSVRATFFLDADCFTPIGVDQTTMQADSVLDSTIWTDCADQWAACSCPGGDIRYGRSGQWTEKRRSSGTMICKDEVFGDPAPGHAKHCECSLDKDGLKPKSSEDMLLGLVWERPVGCVMLQGTVDQEGMNLQVEYASSKEGPWTSAPNSVLNMDGVTRAPADKYEYVGWPKAGGWGGKCQCPSGSIYEVGDQNDGCASLACVGGTVVVPCGEGHISEEHAGWQVTCR